MRQEKPDFLHILQTLSEHKVDFIIVGGVCAVLHGAPISTFDLDIVHSRDTANLDRLMAALEKLEAVYRETSSRRIKPQKDHLASSGHHLLMTKAGPLDLLGEIGDSRRYEQLLDRSTIMHLGGTVDVLVLTLEALIDTKKETAREKDRAALLILQRTLEETLAHRKK
jgi:predicted nucleotidyltransferase